MFSTSSPACFRTPDLRISFCGNASGFTGAMFKAKMANPSPKKVLSYYDVIKFYYPVRSQCTLSLPPENIILLSGGRERVHWEGMS